MGGSVQGNIKKYIDRQRQAKNREGDVIRFEDGHMIKVKNDWYVDVHKNISTSATFTMSRSHNIAKLILEDKLDDVIPHLSEHRLKSVRHFEQLFWDAFQQTEDRLSNLKKTVIQLGYQNDRKSIALEILPTLESKYDGKLLFEIVKALDEDVHSVLVKHVSKVVTS